MNATVIVRIVSSTLVIVPLLVFNRINIGCILKCRFCDCYRYGLGQGTACRPEMQRLPTLEVIRSPYPVLLSLLSLLLLDTVIITHAIIVITHVVVIVGVAPMFVIAMGFGQASRRYINIKIPLGKAIASTLFGMTSLAGNRSGCSIKIVKDLYAVTALNS